MNDDKPKLDDDRTIVLGGITYVLNADNVLVPIDPAGKAVAADAD
jgi:hypothetical protein